MGWTGLRNGQLLAAMQQRGIGGLVTVDRSLGYQQSVVNSGVFVVLLRAHSNRLEQLQPLVPELLRVVAFAQPGQFIRVGDPTIGP